MKNNLKILLLGVTLIFTQGVMAGDDYRPVKCPSGYSVDKHSSQNSFRCKKVKKIGKNRDHDVVCPVGYKMDRRSGKDKCKSIGVNNIKDPQCFTPDMGVPYGGLGTLTYKVDYNADYDKCEEKAKDVNEYKNASF